MTLNQSARVLKDVQIFVQIHYIVFVQIHYIVFVQIYYIIFVRKL